MSQKFDLTGQQFGNWKVLHQAKISGKDWDGGAHWVCECQCEKRTRQMVRSVYLRNGRAKNCGCSPFKHCRTPTWLQTPEAIEKIRAGQKRLIERRAAEKPVMARPAGSKRARRIEELQVPCTEPVGGVSLEMLEEMRVEALEFHLHMAGFEGELK